MQQIIIKMPDFLLLVHLSVLVDLCMNHSNDSIGILSTSRRQVGTGRRYYMDTNDVHVYPVTSLHLALQSSNSCSFETS